MKVKVNRFLLPLKLHFFLFWASISSALPFMMVVARQLGIPVGIQGTVSAAIIATAVLAKPVIAAAADYLPSLRKTIFLALLTVMVATVGPIGFLPPMYPRPQLRGRAVSPMSSGRNGSSYDSPLYMAVEQTDMDSCYLKTGWDCVAFCQEQEFCAIENGSIDFQKLTKLDRSEFDTSGIRSLGDIYEICGVSVDLAGMDDNISVICSGGERVGEDCIAPWQTVAFWIYVLLLLAGQVSATTAESISDAICLDTIGEDGDYGSQRAWGALSYGILGTVSGLLVDWHSGDSYMKDYTPAFLLLVVFGTMDILLSAAYLKVPKFEGGSAMWVNLRPLLRQPRFFVFLLFAFLVGFYDGVDTGYVFMKEDMAAGTSMMKHMKLLQGLTMLVQAFSAAPFMFIYDWFMKKMGSLKVISLVLFLYTIRLLGLALAGQWKVVWATIAIEVINGPCFGLGYTAVIVHASSITPPGTSATVQSVVNICYGTFGYAGASLVGGVLYEAVGGLWLYGITGILAAVTCVLHILCLKFLSPPQEQTIPGNTLETITGDKDDYGDHSPQGCQSSQDKEERHREVSATEEEQRQLLQQPRANGDGVEIKEDSKGRDRQGES